MKNILLASVVFILSVSLVFARGEPPAPHVMNPDLMSVQNRCIVQLSDDIESDNVRGIANALAKRAGAINKYVYENSIKGFTINLPCQAADRAFGASAWVARMEPDSVVSISKGKPNRGGDDTSSERPSQTQDWGVVRVGGPIDDSGTTAWVIDTGVDLDHPDLNVDQEDGFSVFYKRGKMDMDDQNGHGTHVAGTIAAMDNDKGSIGVAPGATIVPVRVLDRRGSGTISGVIAGVDYVAANAGLGDCVNMSLGGGVSESLDLAVIAAAKADPNADDFNEGPYFALAAGNSGVDAQNHSPARVGGISDTDNIFTIAAIAEAVDEDTQEKMPSWSNYGDAVKYAAPGVSIFSLWKDGGTKTISGTSMAAPHACAVLMLTGAGSDNTEAEKYYDEDTGTYPIIHTDY
jgi:subtilisin family serine protease